MNEENFKKKWEQASREDNQIDAETDARLKAGISRKIQAQNRYKKQYWIAAAATFIICFGFAFLYKSAEVEKKTTVVNYFSSNNFKKEIILSDGSSVSLEPHSSLIVAENFGKTDRKITFTGKGTFDIAKNKDKPFRINAKDFTVQVLGTKFFLDQTNGKQKVELFEGKVKINHGGKITFLLPKQTWTKNIETTKENQHVFSDDKRNFAFQDENFDHIIARLETEYQITIDYPKEYRDRKIVGSVTGNLDEVLSTLCYPFNLKAVKISENKIELK